MKKFIAVLLAVLIISGGAAVVLAKSKIDIFDLVFDKDEPEAPAQAASVYQVDIKMVSGQTFRMESEEADFSDIEFEGTLVLQKPDGTYYINSQLVEYIRVNN